MIARLWQGWTAPTDADRYERLLREEIFPEIAAKAVDGYEGIRLLRRAHEEEVEFLTIMHFESWDAVREFAGEDYEAAYVPESARQILSRFDDRSRHYEITTRLDY